MAKKVLTEQEMLQQEKVEERISAVDKFFKENGKLLWGCVIALILIGAAILCYQKFYLQPKQAEAAAQLYPAEASYAAGEYELALNGDGNVPGFVQIIDEYGSKAGSAVYLYAGSSALQLGNYEEALGYLKKYKGKDAILSARALACQGDAYVGLEKLNEALACYEKAAAKADNVYAAGYLLKAGVVCEELGIPAKALTYYKKIKDQYPQSMEGYDIAKYISRIENAQ